MAGEGLATPGGIWLGCGMIKWNLTAVLICVACIAGCSVQYREDYELRARRDAEAACHSEGTFPGEKAYSRCFYKHFDSAMLSAPSENRPVEARKVSDDEICEGFGFRLATDGFATCLETRYNAKRQLMIDASQHRSSPSPLVYTLPMPVYQLPNATTCTSVSMGSGTSTTTCNYR